MKEKYTLEVNEEQLRLIQNSLDLYSRVLIGQFEEVAQVAAMYNVNMLEKSETGNTLPDKSAYQEHHIFTDKIRECKSILGFHPNGSYGIFNQGVHNDARNSFDIVQVIRKHLAEKYYKEGDSRMFVSFDEPQQYGEYQMPILEDKNND